MTVRKLVTERLHDGADDPQDEDDVGEVEELGKPTADSLDADDWVDGQSDGSDETE